jgi:hypothetical protein
MELRKCTSCGQPAYAYRLEPDGSRVYLCLKHLPEWDSPPPEQKTSPRNQAREGDGE